MKRISLAFAAFCALAVTAAPAQAQGVYAALAISTKTGAYGFGYNYPSADQARQRALAECEKHANKAGDCRVYAAFQRACISIAQSSNGSYGWMIGGPNDERPERALNECAAQNGTDCKIVSQFCSTGQ